MSDSPEFLIADILPKNEIHLLGGSSGSGKTTFLFQTLAKWQRGEEVLGHRSYPVPYVYVSADRSRSSVTRTLQRLNLHTEITRMLCREDLPTELSLRALLDSARQQYPDSSAFFIEGFQTLVGDKGNSYTHVASLLAATTTFCAREQITIVGICHSPKLKIEEGFQHPREMILGSVAWAAYSDTIIVMDRNEKSGIISCQVLPRNAAHEEHQFVFLPPNGALGPPPNNPKGLLTLLILAVPVGDEVTRQQVLKWAKELTVPLRTAERTINELVDEKELTPTMIRGTYLRTAAPSM